MGRTGPRRRGGGYPTRKGADFRHGLDGREGGQGLDRWRRWTVRAERTGERGQTAWSDIEWAAVEAAVRRLQDRIDRAARVPGGRGLSRMTSNRHVRF